MCDSGCDEVPRSRFSVKKEREMYREVTLILSDIFLLFMVGNQRPRRKR